MRLDDKSEWRKVVGDGTSGARLWNTKRGLRDPSREWNDSDCIPAVRDPGREYGFEGLVSEVFRKLASMGSQYGEQQQEEEEDQGCSPTRSQAYHD